LWIEVIGAGGVFKLQLAQANSPGSLSTQSSVMNRCIILSAISIVCRLRKLFRRHRQGRGAPAERLIVVDPDQVSQTAEPSSPPPGPSPSVDGNSGPQLVDDIQQDQPPLPPSCSRLQLGDIEILDEHPSCAGAFANIWNGSLAGDRVVVKSYRIYSTVDSTHARMVRLP